MKGREKIENRARGSKPQCLSHSNFKRPRISNPEKDIILKPPKTNYTLHQYYIYVPNHKTSYTSSSSPSMSIIIIISLYATCGDIHIHTYIHITHAYCYCYCMYTFSVNWCRVSSIQKSLDGL